MEFLRNDNGNVIAYRVIKRLFPDVENLGFYFSPEGAENVIYKDSKGESLKWRFGASDDEACLIADSEKHQWQIIQIEIKD